MGKVLLGLVTHIESAHSVGSGPLHGHTFRIEVTVEGEYEKGIDFHVFEREVNKIVKELDHKNLNEILNPPVIENIARYIAEKLKGKYKVREVKVWEGKGKFCILIVE